MKKKEALLKRVRRRKGESGQSMVEYLLVTIVVVLIVLGVFTLFENTELIFTRLTSPLVSFLKYNYKYGHKDALGWDEGTPRKHIQIAEPGGDTFRIFIPVTR